jgi:hypothetical protein
MIGVAQNIRCIGNKVFNMRYNYRRGFELFPGCKSVIQFEQIKSVDQKDHDAAAREQDDVFLIHITFLNFMFAPVRVSLFF